MPISAKSPLIEEAPVRLIQANEEDEKEFLGVIGSGVADYCIDHAN
jgi:hypothetical protein